MTIDSKEQTSSASLIWASLAILFLVCAVVLGLQIRNLSRARATEAELHARAIAIMTASDAHVVSKTNATLVVSRSRGIVLLASDLPRLPEGKTFELWFMPQRTNGIMFGSTSSHTAEIVTDDPAGAAAVMVTIERSGDDAARATSPNGSPLLTIPLP